LELSGPDADERANCSGTTVAFMIETYLDDSGKARSMGMRYGCATAIIFSGAGRAH
jgi:hypothetical protein